MTNNLKKIFAIFISLILTLNLNSIAFAANLTYIKKDTYEPNTVVDEIEISGITPRIDGNIVNEKLTIQLNKDIRSSRDHEIKSAADSVTSINFTYSVKQNNSIVSILLYTELTSFSKETKVTSFNFDTDTQKTVALNDTKALGPNAINLANKAVLAKINATPDKYNTNFSGVSNTQDFYIEDNTVVLLFDELEIAPGYEGIQEIAMPLKSLSTHITESTFVSEKGNYNLKMVQLKEVAEKFDYTLKWIPKTNEITIYKNSNYITRLTVDQNQYYKGQSAKRQLEAAPKIEDGRTWVPISFFEEILEIFFSVEVDTAGRTTGRITFSQYTPPVN